MATLIIEGRVQDVFASLVKQTKIHLGNLTRDPKVQTFIQTIESGKEAEITFDQSQVEFKFQPGKGLFWKNADAMRWTLSVSM